MSALVMSLLLAFQLKHWTCDFLLQNYYMLGKFNRDWSFVLPLLVHSAVHAVGSLLICLVIDYSVWWLCLIDLATHFVIDRIKASPRMLGRYTDHMDVRYWWALGADQMAHQFVYIGIVFQLAKS